MTRHTEAWFERRNAQAREWLALASKIHTPEELAAARAALNPPPLDMQPELELRPAA